MEIDVRTRQLLRSVRTEGRLLLRAAVAASGVDAAALSRYETGRKVPRSDTLEHLLQTFGFELDVRPTRSVSARFTDALRPLKADSPFAYVVDLDEDTRTALLEDARAA